MPVALAVLLAGAAASWCHTDPPGATLTAVDQALEADPALEAAVL